MRKTLQGQHGKALRATRNFDDEAARSTGHPFGTVSVSPPPISYLRPRSRVSGHVRVLGRGGGGGGTVVEGTQQGPRPGRYPQQGLGRCA